MKVTWKDLTGEQTEQTIEDLEQKGGRERERYQVQIAVPQDIDKIMRLFI